MAFNLSSSTLELNKNFDGMEVVRDRYYYDAQSSVIQISIFIYLFIMHFYYLFIPMHSLKCHRVHYECTIVEEDWIFP